GGVADGYTWDQPKLVLFYLLRLSAGGGGSSRHERNDRRGPAGGAGPPARRQNAGGDEALGIRAADRVGRAGPRPYDRDGPGRPRDPPATRQEDRALDLRHAALPRRPRDDLQPRGSH